MKSFYSCLTGSEIVPKNEAKKKLINRGMESVDTESMLVKRKWLWIGDALRETGYASSRSSYIQSVAAVVRYVCGVAVLCPHEVIGFRASTKHEKRLSRFGRSIVFAEHLRHLEQTAHLTVLVEIMPDCRRAQLMFSASLDHPASIECIDVDRAPRVRLVLWVGKELRQMYAFGDSFVAVWCETVLPRSCELNAGRCRIREKPWIFANLKPRASTGCV